jgi:hypothetical protein
MPPVAGAAAPGLPATTCWRCQAPVYPGQPFCANCGLDYRTFGIAPAPKRRTKLIVLGAIIASLVAAVGGFAVLSQSSGWTPAPEQSPQGTWYSFTSPDGSWGVMFPGSATPQVMSQKIPVGTEQAEVTYNLVNSGGVVYEAGVMDIPSGQLSVDRNTNLKSFEQGIKIFATITGSRDLTFQGKQARELKFKYTNVDLDGFVRFWVSGDRVYILMVAGAPGATMYPQHFFDTFKAN